MYQNQTISQWGTVYQQYQMRTHLKQTTIHRVQNSELQYRQSFRIIVKAQTGKKELLLKKKKNQYVALLYFSCYPIQDPILIKNKFVMRDKQHKWLYRVSLKHLPILNSCRAKNCIRSMLFHLPVHLHNTFWVHSNMSIYHHLLYKHSWHFGL